MLEQVRMIAPYEKGNQKAYRNYFARDINAKLYGYGGVCPCCGYETGVLNSFVVKKFTIGLMNGEKEQKFNFSLYLCRNDAAAASGWLIDDVSIGGMTPFLWLEEIAEIDSIPPEFLYCRIKFRRQVTYDIVEPGDTNVPETVYDGAPEVLDIVLSPLMAAKWFEDNASPATREAAIKEAAAKLEKPVEEPAAEISAVLEVPEEDNEEIVTEIKPTEEINRMRVGAEKDLMSGGLTPKRLNNIGDVQM